MLKVSDHLNNIMKYMLNNSSGLGLGIVLICLLLSGHRAFSVRCHASRYSNMIDINKKGHIITGVF